MTILLGREIGAGFAGRSEKETRRVRLVFNDTNHVDKSTYMKVKARRSTKFLVKGRISGGHRLWDIYELDGFSTPKMIASGFAFQEEAIAHAREKTMGRVAVSFGGIRGLFVRGSSGISTPNRSIELPGKSVVPIRGNKDGSVTVG